LSAVARQRRLASTQSKRGVVTDDVRACTDEQAEGY
jgi:hypothetical protein